jgi:uncharacterized protein
MRIGCRLRRTLAPMAVSAIFGLWMPLLTILPVTTQAASPAEGYTGSYAQFFRAAKIDHVDITRDLLARGMDPNTIEEERGETAMMVALRENSMKVFETLLNAPDIKLEARARNGDTALMIASFVGNAPAVAALLAKGAQVNQTGWTALHYAAASGQDGIIRMLLEKSAYIDAESPNKTTPLMMAARAGKIYTVKLLLEEGADASLKNAQGLNAIDFAAQNNFTDIAEGLTSRLKKEGKL